MKTTQKEIALKARERGIHLVTSEIEGALDPLRGDGLVHFHLLHTSAALSLNENADPDVRRDMHAFIEELIPENIPYFRHTQEGPDDMPGHIKAVFFGHDLTVPVHRGRLVLGQWQGIYLCEFRNNGGSRKIWVTAMTSE